MNITRKIYQNLASKGFTGILIVGEPSIGKSMLACGICREISSTDGISSSVDSDEAWEYAIKQCVYTPARFDQELDGYNFKNKRRVIVWEDIGTTAGKYAFTLGFKYLNYLKANMDLIRTNLDCLIMTTPTDNDLLNFLGGYGFLKINITKLTKWNRLATTYHKVNKSKSGLICMRWQRWFYDTFSCYCPTKWYREYLDHSEREKVSRDFRKKMVEQYEISYKRMMLNNKKIDKQLKELEDDETKGFGES